MAPMGDHGKRITERRDRLGMTVVELAKRARVHRNTLMALERGEGVRTDTLAKVERALDELELEAGFDVPPARPEEQRLVTFEVDLGEGAASVVVRGPVEDIGVLEEAVKRLLARRNDED